MLGSRVFVPILLALAFTWLFVEGRSRGTDVAPQLVRVLEVVPDEVEVGDRVAVLGEGFPAGKAARLAFCGTLHRPGVRPVHGVAIAIQATVVAPNRLEFAFDDATQALFSGAGDRAIHTTFEGQLEVAFAAAARGAPPIAGVLDHVTLDVRPSGGASQRERERDGERALSWLGIRAVAGRSGLLVDGLAPGSPAQAVGIAVGDVLTTFDGVRVASAADVIPPPGEDAATLGIRSGQLVGATASPREPLAMRGETTRVIRMAAFRRAAPSELVAAALTVFGALAAVWLFAAPARPLFASLLQRIVTRTRERIGPHGSARTVVRVAFRVARSSLPPPEAAAIADFVVCALLATMPFGQDVVTARLDVGLLFVAGLACLATAAFVARESPWQGLRAALEVAWQHTPAAGAVASIVVTTGSLRIQEIAQAQGGWPWDWLAFRSPASLVALGLLLACALIDTGTPMDDARPQSLTTLLDHTAQDDSGRRAPWREAACRAHRILVAGLATAIFLGGWLLPGLSVVEQAAHPALEVAGAIWLVVKTYMLVSVTAWVRWLLPPWRLVQGTRTTALWIAPLTAVSFSATAVWTWWGPPPVAQLLTSASLILAFAMSVIALGRWLRHGLGSTGADVHLSPFL